MLEGMEGCPCRGEVLKFLGEQLWESLIYTEERIPLFLILIDNREGEIPSLLRNRLRLCRTNVPNQAQRGLYLEKHAKYLGESLSLKQFAQITEGAGYAQLRDMIVLVDGLLESRDGRPLTDEELGEFLASQMPLPSPENTTQKLYRTLEKLANQLLQIMSGMAVAPQVTAVPAAQASTDPAEIQNEAVYLADKRREIEEMAPSLLCEEVFGDRMRN